MRETLDMNPGWRFHRGEITFRNHGGIHAARYRAAEWMKAGNQGVAQPAYPDTEWEPVDLPHDFVIDSGFSPEANLTHGSLPTDVGWYRKTFAIPEEDRGKRLRLEFDGVYRDAQVWMNGNFVGRHLSGYTGFAFDVTELCHFGGLNTVAVRADAREFELWSYEGGGIYRDVRLVKTGRVRVRPRGVWVRPDNFEGEDPAEVGVDLTVSYANADREPQQCVLAHVVRSPEGEIVFSGESDPQDLSAYGEGEHRIGFKLSRPTLWSTDAPCLYSLETTVKVDGRITDNLTTRFGVRSVRFDAETGFYLNGQPLKLKGVCNHQDHAGVGVAVPAALEDWRVGRVKAMGANAIRTSHNPAGPALLDACDRLGVLVMDEQRQVGASEEHLQQLTSLIQRDRNHPCVVAWSLGNEEMLVQHTEIGVRQMRRMQDLCHELDPTRPATYAMNCNWLENAGIHNDLGFRLDVYGANYVCRDHYEMDGTLYDDFHSRYPDWPLIGSETGGSASTRGVYRPQDAHPGLTYHPTTFWRNPERKGVISGYGETCTPWGSTVEQTWKDCHDRPFLAGTFLWTGFDYRGETYPAQWPAVITCYGLMDLCGFPKDAFHYYRVWWRDEPALHLFPHWNWRGSEGQTIDVWCYSNGAEVELELNGQSLGRLAMPPREHVAWEVPYTPGTLVARAYDADGQVVATQAIETSGPAAALSLSAGTDTLRADARDVVPVTVSAVDAQGRPVPTADAQARFDVTGPAKILGVGNGNPCSHEPDRAPRRRLFQGLCQVLLQSTGETGTVTLRAVGDEIAGAELKLAAVTAETGPRVLGVDAIDHAGLVPETAVDNAL